MTARIPTLALTPGAFCAIQFPARMHAGAPEPLFQRTEHRRMEADWQSGRQSRSRRQAVMPEPHSNSFYRMQEDELRGIESDRYACSTTELHSHRVAIFILEHLLPLRKSNRFCFPYEPANKQLSRSYLPQTGSPVRGL